MVEEEQLRAVIAAAQAGDVGALKDLVRRYQPFLVRLARRQLRSAPGGPRPSDLVQDTLERFVRSLRSFQGTCDQQLRGWLSVILTNVLIQQRRSASRQRREAEHVPLPDADRFAGPDPMPSPSQQLHGQEAWRALLRAMFALPEGQQEAVHRHLRGESVAEIAQTLGKTPAAVSCLLQRGGKALQRKLGQSGQLGAWFQSMKSLLAGAP